MHDEIEWLKSNREKKKSNDTKRIVFLYHMIDLHSHSGNLLKLFNRSILNNQNSIQNDKLNEII